MKILIAFLFALSATLSAQTPSMAVIGLRHSHVWGHINKMIKGEPAKLVGIAETEPELIDEARKRGATTFYSDYKKMLDETKPAFVWAFVDNSRHLEIVEACA